jgi:hypothetical protein
MGMFSRCVVVALATVALAGGVHAQQDASGTTPTTQVAMTATLQALQTAVDNKDATAIFNILNSVPRDQRAPLTTLLLTAAQNATDKQFGATLAALAFVSGGLTTAQANTAITVVRNAPAGLVIVNTLLSSNLTGGFGFATTNTSGFLIANLVVTENQNQTQVSPN